MTSQTIHLSPLYNGYFCTTARIFCPDCRPIIHFRLCSHLVPEYLCLGTGTKCCCVHTLSTQDIDMLAVPEFWRGYLEKRCVHIRAQRESYLGTVLGHQV